MKTRIFSALVIFATLFSHAVFFCGAESPYPLLSARSAVLLEAESGRILLEKNANTRMAMASTTKIMTALTVLRLADKDSCVVIPEEAVGIEGSSIYLTKGERLSVEQLLYALLLSSANDAAVALAIYCSGSVGTFADRMNDYAAEIGLKNSHFVNPHGLHDKQHYTTAHDLALITQVALENELLRTIFSSKRAYIPSQDAKEERLLINHNKLLSSYEGAIGVKTGYTKMSGRCLVSAAQRDGMTLICVTLNAPDDWRDHAMMLDYGFANYERRLVLDVFEFRYDIPAVGANKSSLTLTNTSPIVLTLKKSEGDPSVAVESCFHFVYAPISKGQTIAVLRLTLKDQSCVSSLIAAERLESS